MDRTFKLFGCACRFRLTGCTCRGNSNNYYAASSATFWRGNCGCASADNAADNAAAAATFGEFDHGWC
jgi:hypothetical protein